MTYLTEANLHHLAEVMFIKFLHLKLVYPPCHTHPLKEVIIHSPHLRSGGLCYNISREKCPSEPTVQWRADRKGV